MVKIEKDLFVRDENKVRRRVFVAGMVVQDWEYAQYFDLEEIKKSAMEYKILPEEPQDEVPGVESEGLSEPSPTEKPQEVTDELVAGKPAQPKVGTHKAKK